MKLTVVSAGLSTPSSTRLLADRLVEAARDELADQGHTVSIEVIELDCAEARFRRVSAATTRRNGEMSGSNEPGAFETYPEGSVMAQIAGPLCEGVGGG